MTDSDFKKTMIGLVAVALVLLSFCAGLLYMRSQPQSPQLSPVPPVPQVAQGVDPPAAAVPDNTPAADPPAEPKWGFSQNECKVTQTGTQFRITGATDHDGWDNNTHGLSTVTDYPEGNFTISADFMAPKFTGPGYRQIILRAHSADGSSVALVHLASSVYYLQTWNPKGTTPGMVGPFPDEATAFHTMKLRYDATNQKATGWVDDRLVGTTTAHLSGRLTFEMTTGSDKAGQDIDLVFDHFTFVQDP